jgi:hypothetical protein
MGFISISQQGLLDRVALLGQSKVREVCVPRVFKTDALFTGVTTWYE